MKYILSCKKEQIAKLEGAACYYAALLSSFCFVVDQEKKHKAGGVRYYTRLTRQRRKKCSCANEGAHRPLNSFICVLYSIFHLNPHPQTLSPFVVFIRFTRVLRKLSTSSSET